MRGALKEVPHRQGAVVHVFRHSRCSVETKDRLTASGINAPMTPIHASEKEGDLEQRIKGFLLHAQEQQPVNKKSTALYIVF